MHDASQLRLEAYEKESGLAVLAVAEKRLILQPPYTSPPTEVGPSEVAAVLEAGDFEASNQVFQSLDELTAFLRSTLHLVYSLDGRDLSLRGLFTEAAETLDEEELLELVESVRRGADEWDNFALLAALRAGRDVDSPALRAALRESSRALSDEVRSWFVPSMPQLAEASAWKRNRPAVFFGRSALGGR